MAWNMLAYWSEMSRLDNKCHISYVIPAPRCTVDPVKNVPITLNSAQ